MNQTHPHTPPRPRTCDALGVCQQRTPACGTGMHCRHDSACADTACPGHPGGTPADGAHELHHRPGGRRVDYTRTDPFPPLPTDPFPRLPIVLLDDDPPTEAERTIARLRIAVWALVPVAILVSGAGLALLAGAAQQIGGADRLVELAAAAWPTLGR